VRIGGARARGLGAVAALLVVVAGCGLGAASPPPGCPTEPRAAGTLPDLEALLPALPDSTVDSGWNCRPERLRTYARHGVSRLEFAGATEEHADGSSIVVAVYRSGTGDPPLQAAWVEEFYEGSARESGRVDNIETRRESIAAAGEVWRMDGLNGLSLQSVVVWQGESVVRVVLVASEVGPDANRAEHDALVAATVGTAVAPGASSGSPAPRVLPSAA
jgi:hypothetical protein